MNTAPDSSWFYSENQQQLGPLAFSELQKKFAGGLPQSTLVWTKGMDDWLPAAKIPALAQAADSNPYAAPTVPDPAGNIVLPDAALPANAVYAGFLTRFAAFFVDAIIVAAIGGIFGGIFGALFAIGTNIEDPVPFK